MACTPQDLSTEAKCFMCLSEKQLMAIIAYASCEYGGGGGGSEPLVYRALLTQANEDVDSGLLVIGDTYEIIGYTGDDNFTNVGAVANGDGIIFQATGTTPADWSSQSVLSHKLSPVATVLENTLGGEVVWTRNDVGDYFGTLLGAFPSDKTFTFGNLGQGYNNTSLDFLGIAVAAEGDILRVVVREDELLVAASVGCDVYP